MIRNIFLFILPLLISYNVSAQKESFIWYFAALGLDFHFDPPQMLTNGYRMGGAGCGTICDQDGNLLFYTDGQYVINKNHQLMKNGGTIGGNNKVLQSGLIIPSPGPKNIYYIFSNGVATAGNFSYSVVDINKEGGLGAVTSKNNILISSNCTGKVTAVRHSNNIDVWVITHKYNSNAFYAYLVTGSGLKKNPIISYCGSILNHVAYTVGQLKVSPDGNLLVNAIAYKGFELFYFDTKTGTIIAPYYHVLDQRTYTGAEFSPNGRYLYLTDHGGPVDSKNCIWQYDLNSIDSTDFVNSRVLLFNPFSMLGTCQLAIDGKVYVGSTDTCIKVINKPNLKGVSCNYIDKAVCYNSNVGYSFPDFLQNYFYVPDFKSEQLCLGDTTHFKLTDLYRVDSVFWNFNDTVSAINNHSKLIGPKHYFADTGIYKVSIIVYRDTLTDTFNRNIRISPYPSASFTVSDTTLCLNGNIFYFTNSSLINTGSITYEWDFGDSIKEFIKDTIHSYLHDSTYRVKLVAISDYGCTNTAYKQLTVLPSPSASFSISDTMLCLKANLFSFTNNSTINRQESLNFIWNFGDFTTDTTKHPTHQYSVTDTFLVKLVATTQNGCKDSVNKTIFVYPEPKAGFIINDTTQCFSGNLFNFSNSTIGASGFNWDFGDKTTDTIANPSHSYTYAGTFSIRLHTFSQNGCSDSLIKMISIHPQPIPAFNVNDSSQCQNANLFSFINASSGAKSYFWDFGDLTTDTISHPTHQYSVADTFVVSLIATSQDGCKDSISKNLTVVPSPKAGFTPNDSTQCLSGNLFTFSNTTTGAKSNIWHFGNGTTDTAFNPVYSYSSTGTYLVKLKAQNIYGCGDSITRKIEVFPMPSAGFIINTNPQYLSGNSFNFTNQTTLPSGIIYYLWDFGDGDTSSLKDPAHSYKTADTFDVKLVAFTINGCKDSVIHKIWLLYPQINAEFQFKDICLGDYAFFKNTSTIQKDSFLNFLWNFGDGSQPITGNDPRYLYADTGIYQVQMVALTYKGFKDTASHNIRVFPSPTVHITADPDTIVEEGITVTLTANGMFDSIFWNIGKSSTNIEVDKTGRYSIRVVAFNGCDASDSIMILYIPKTRFSAMNVITPNGDGINDLWKIDHIDKYQPCKVGIYNRWGDELYSTNNYQNNWDGTYKSNKLPEGTYYFVLVAKDGKVYKGAVNIMK